MKFSVLRSKEKKDKEDLEKLLKSLATFNPNATFKPREGNSSHICSSLDLKDLSSLSLPIGVSFTIDPFLTAKPYGLVNIRYRKRKYIIFGEGLEASYLIK